MASLKERLEFAADVAQRAGEVTLRYFQTGIDVERKSDATPVTIADRETETFLRDEIRSRFPEDAVFGEEFGELPGTSGFRWVVDPIDGTKSFIQGVPLYGVMVGLRDPAGQSACGAVAIPGVGDVVCGALGEGAFWNGAPARVSEVSQLDEACVLHTGHECFEMTGTHADWARVQEAVRITRGWGDCYGHLLVATGRAEAMLDPILAEWDCVALIPILEEAGGRFTDWQGNPGLGESGVSTNAALGSAIRNLIAGR